MVILIDQRDFGGRIGRGVGAMLFDPAQPLIVHASFDREVISPNADGVE
ncbi:MAG UNVERIFIED_CONTAM: hypothetical protein LVT10_03830 [Anaerolineae bacterium]|jgi:hypothetical protein